MDIEVKLQVFEGPLELLLHLIDINKVSIYDIPIVEITRQYMEYVNAMEKSDLNLVGDFLVMAATLLDIKSKMLLPPEEDEEGEEIDPREELVQRLLEYKMIKQAACELKQREEDAGNILYREPHIPPEVAKYEPPVDLDELMSNVTLLRLHLIFEDILRRQKDKIDPIRSRFGNIEKQKVRLGDKMKSIFQYARDHHDRFSFRNLLEEQPDRENTIVSFLAILELMKVGQIQTEQEETFGDILISWNYDSEYTFTEQDMEQYE